MNLNWWVEFEEPDLWDIVPEFKVGYYNNRISFCMYHPLHHWKDNPWSKVESLYCYSISMTKNHGSNADYYDLYEGWQ